MGKSYGSKTKLTLLSTIAAVALLSLAGVANADSSPRMVGSQWAVFEENTLPNGDLHFFPATHATTIPTSGVEFPFPDATSPSPTYVNFILNTFTTSLIESNTITATIRVTTSSPITTFVGNPNGGCPGASTSTCPGTVRLFIQSNLPSDGSAFCVGGNKNVNNYWWSNTPVTATLVSPGSYYLFTTGGSGGTVTLSVPLSPSDWSNICGQFGTSNLPAFDSAIANIKYVALSFGSGFFFSNGVGVDGTTGTATFQLISYTIS